MLAIVINTVSVLVYLLSTVVILRRHSRYLPLFGFVSLTQLWTLVSCFYNDLGIYNFELFRYTSVTFATTRLALFYVVFNVGFALIAAILRHRVPVRRDYVLSDPLPNIGILKLFLYALSTVAVAYIVFSLLSKGIPLLTGLDRYSYLKQAGYFARFVNNWALPLAFVLGLTRRGRRRFSLNGIALAGMFVYFVLVGHKFSTLSSLLVFYYAPIAMRYAYENPDWRPLKLRYVIQASCVILVFVTYAYSVYGRKLENTELAKVLLLDRVFATQGEIWWAVDDGLSKTDGYDSKHWEDELSFLLSPTSLPQENVGMRYLMIKILGAKVAYRIFETGYLYTMAYPAILIATFPWAVALFMQFFAGAAFLAMLYYLFWCVIRDQRVRALITFLVVLPYVVFLATGSFSVFFSLGMLTKIAVLVCLETAPVLVKRWPFVLLQEVESDGKRRKLLPQLQDKQCSIQLLGESHVE